MNTGERGTGNQIEEVPNILSFPYYHIATIVTIKSATILDYGCGNGYGLRHLKQMEPETLVGYDYNDKVILKNQRMNDGIEYTSRFEDLERMKMKFDLIICYQTIEHLDDYYLELVRMAGMLKRGGYLAIATPDKEQFSKGKKALFPFHVHEFYQQEMLALIDSQGLSIFHSVRFGYATGTKLDLECSEWKKSLRGKIIDRIKHSNAVKSIARRLPLWLKRKITGCPAETAHNSVVMEQSDGEQIYIIGRKP